MHALALDPPAGPGALEAPEETGVDFGLVWQRAQEEASPRLGRANLFLLACREAFRDGRVLPAENALLQRLQRFLEIAPAMAQQLAKHARREFLTHRLPRPREVIPERLFVKACKLAYAAGTPTADERRLLRGLAKVLDLDEGRARELHDRASDPSCGVSLACLAPLPPMTGEEVVEEPRPAVVPGPEGGEEVDDLSDALTSPRLPVARRPLDRGRLLEAVAQAAAGPVSPPRHAPPPGRTGGAALQALVTGVFAAACGLAGWAAILGGRLEPQTAAWVGAFLVAWGTTRSLDAAADLTAR